MNKCLNIYKCELCGNIVEMLTVGDGQLICCGKPMACLKEQEADKSLEKHVPIIERVDGGYKIIVGSTPHPMTEEHHIEWIELIAGSKTMKQYLKPNDTPIALFCSCREFDENDIYVREYCNKHGLWKS